MAVHVCMNNLAVKHDTTELITPFHSELTVHSNDISILYCEKIPKIGENPLIIGALIKFCHFCNVFKTLNNPYQ